MPKIVDHEQRYQELARAAWRALQAGGVQGVSVRAVAREAGWSPSAVQYYFPSQADLLTFAMRLAGDALQEHLEGLQLPADPRAAATVLLEALLPIDEEVRRVTEVWVAFLARAPFDATAQEVTVQDNEELGRRVYRYLVDRLATAGYLPPGADADLEAARLHALVDGMTLQAVTDPARMPPERMRSLLALHLDSLTRTS